VKEYILSIVAPKLKIAILLSKTYEILVVDCGRQEKRSGEE
jgi:hypothetical protein